MNEAQQYEGNVEASAAGTARLRLCSNGTASASFRVEGAWSDILATHIHRCNGGSTPQTRTSVLCQGPPVVAFCGDNAPGQMDVGTPYTQPCGALAADHTAETSDAEGALVEENTNMTMDELMRDIIGDPESYYFNVHSDWSRMHAYPATDEGMCRGELRLVIPTTTTAQAAATTAPPHSSSSECFFMFSQMVANELQQYEDNPEADMSGYADIVICTNGTLRASVQIFGGVPTIIAMHIHRCSGGETPQTRTAELCGGGAVVNFCGDNSPGLLSNGVDTYPEPCTMAARGEFFASIAEMVGVVAPAAGASTPAEVEALVRDMDANPDSYFFNIHTVASFTHWYPGHRGMCRGPLQRS